VPLLRSGPLAAWAAAFFAGRVSIDQAADAVTGDDAPHRVSGIDTGLVPLRELLVLWRRAGAVRVVLPVPGDVRGLPGPAEFRRAALEQGEAVVGSAYGAVPDVVDHAPSSAPPSVVWQAFETEPAPPDFVSIADAQYELTTAIRESASTLSALGKGAWGDELSDSLKDARRAGERLNLPPGFPPNAVALIAQAERLQAVLDLAAADPERLAALRPLGTAVRRARVAGYNATVDQS